MMPASGPVWCAVCAHPNPTGTCPRCASTDTTTLRPDGDWGDPTLRRHGETGFRVLHRFPAIIRDPA